MRVSLSFFKIPDPAGTLLVVVAVCWVLMVKWRKYNYRRRAHRYIFPLRRWLNGPAHSASLPRWRNQNRRRWKRSASMQTMRKVPVHPRSLVQTAMRPVVQSRCYRCWRQHPALLKSGLLAVLSGEALSLP
jgi:hypothetical protein